MVWFRKSKPEASENKIPPIKTEENELEEEQDTRKRRRGSNQNLSPLSSFTRYLDNPRQNVSTDTENEKSCDISKKTKLESLTKEQQGFDYWVKEFANPNKDSEVVHWPEYNNWFVYAPEKQTFVFLNHQFVHHSQDEPPKVLFNQEERQETQNEDISRQVKIQEIQEEVTIKLPPIRISVNYGEIDPVDKDLMAGNLDDPRRLSERPREVIEKDRSISTWLASVNMSEHIVKFARAEIKTLDDLASLPIDSKFLCMIGINKEFHRLLILDEIACLKDTSSTIEEYLKFKNCLHLCQKLKDMGADDLALVKQFGKRNLFSLIQYNK